MVKIDTSQRRLSAIMFSDICGYSSLMGQDEALAMEVLAHHDKVVNAGLKKFNGKTIKRMGDGVLAEFPSAVGAVDCALAIQRHMRVYNKKAPEKKRFELRIGVHLGDIIVTDDDILGDGVNVAARIEPLALPGGICISQDVYNQIQNKIEVEVVSIGPQQLKNIRRQIEIFRVLVAAADRESLAPSNLEATPAKAKQRTEIPRWVWAVVAASIILLLLVSTHMLGARRKARDRAAWKTAEKNAATLFKAGMFADARDVLEKASAKVSPDTPGVDRARNQIQRIADAEQKDRIRKRYGQFMKAVLHKDIPLAITFIDLESRKHHGPNGLRFRMKGFTMIAAAGKLSPTDLRIREIHLGDDRTSATVMTEIYRDRVWKPSKPSRWRLQDDEWYLVLRGKPRR